MVESTSLGAAFAAAVGIKLKSFDEVCPGADPTKHIFFTI
jgi:hypothetical protein